MAITVSTKLTPEMYTPLQEREETNPTRFQLKPLTGAEYIDIMCHMISDGEGGQRLSKDGIEKIIRYSVLSVENLLNEKGNPIKKFRSDMLGPILLSELAAHIMEISEIGDTERKNSL